MSFLFLGFLGFFVSVAAPFLPFSEGGFYLSNNKLRSDIIGVERNSDFPVKSDILSLGPKITAKSALVMDKETGKILFSLNESKVYSLASLTKLMTAFVFLESSPNLDDLVQMRFDDDRQGARLHIRPGERASFLSYLKASLIGSANNATIVLSRSIGVTGEEFIKLMNIKAVELGMLNTVFFEPSGLDPNNKGSARDMAILLSVVQENSIIRDITSNFRDIITVYPGQVQRLIISTNQLTNSIVDVALGKTGYLDESLYNLANIIKLKNNKEIIVITLGSATNEDRFQDNKMLAIWAQNSYKWE